MNFKIFELISNINTQGIRVDLFQKMETNNNNDSNDNGHDVSFNKIAFGYIYPVNASESSGIFTVPITSKMGKIIAHFKGIFVNEFTIIFRFCNLKFYSKFRS